MLISVGDMGVSSVGPHNFGAGQKKITGVEILVRVELMIL